MPNETATSARMKRCMVVLLLKVCLQLSSRAKRGSRSSNSHPHSVSRYPPEAERRVHLSVTIEVVLDRHLVTQHHAGELVAVGCRAERERQRTVGGHGTGLLEVAFIVDPVRCLVIGVTELQGKALQRVHDQSRRLEAVQPDHPAVGVADGDQLPQGRPVDLLQYVAALHSTLVRSWLLRIVVRRLGVGTHGVTALAGT